jgi:hypothetical protein
MRKGFAAFFGFAHVGMPGRRQMGSPLEAEKALARHKTEERFGVEWYFKKP